MDMVEPSKGGALGSTVGVVVFKTMAEVVGASVVVALLVGAEVGTCPTTVAPIVMNTNSRKHVW